MTALEPESHNRHRLNRSGTTANNSDNHHEHIRRGTDKSNSSISDEDDRNDIDLTKKTNSAMVFKSMMNSTKLAVLLVLCCQNTVFTVLRRYSQGVLKEDYSKVRRIILVDAPHMHPYYFSYQCLYTNTHTHVLYLILILTRPSPHLYLSL